MVTMGDIWALFWRPINFIVIGLMYSLLLTSFYQYNAQRLYAVLVFCAEVLGYYFFLSHLEGFMRYFSGALGALVVIILTSGIRPLPKMVLNLQKICIISILLNVYGWVVADIWPIRLSYGVAFIILYLSCWFYFLQKDEDDGRGFGISEWMACFSIRHYSWRCFIDKYLGRL